MASANSEKRFRLHSMQNGRCALCGREILLAEATLDHRFPKSRGGSNALFNLQVAHGSCNQAKGSRLIIKFVPKEHLKDLTRKQLKDLTRKQLKDMVFSHLCDRTREVAGLTERDRMMEAMDDA